MADQRRPIPRHAVVRSGEPPWSEGHDLSPGAAGSPARHQVMIDGSGGSVHMTLGWVELPTATQTAVHVHSFETSIYVVAGLLDLAVGDRVHRLAPHDYALVPTAAVHACRAAGSSPARWLEVTAPQQRQEPADTFVVDQPVSWEQAQVPDWASPLRGQVGRFTEDQLPPPSQLQMDGYSGGDVTGIRLKMLIDRPFGAQQMNLFMVEFPPGGAGNEHDHSFEEAYVFLSGSAEAILDGKHVTLGPGDVVWTGVGCVHGFFPAGDQPVRWIELQAPQPPAQNAFRFARPWRHVGDISGWH